MELEIIEGGKQAEQIRADCCISDIWVVLLPDSDEA